MARTGGLSFSSLIDIQIVLLLLRISTEAYVFLGWGFVWAVSALYQRQVWNFSRSDDRGSPDFNSVQHTVFLHLLQMQPVPGLTCRAKWRLSSGKKISR